MDAAALERSVLSLGSSVTWSPLFERLDAGKPIVLGVFGASVAQNGGCLDQPYKRCMRYDGVHRTFMRWGEPHIRPFKGFAVRLLEHVNTTWPHRAHQINNSALDATPAQNALPCLFSHLPTTLHIVVLEFGSMAFHLKLAAVEGAARMLLSLRPRPVLVFLSMHEWCQRLKDTPRTLYLPGERLRGGFVYPDTPWARAEAETLRVCERYGQVCLSAQRALDPLVRSGASGFSLADVVGDDCLHPTHGRRGAEYVAQILAHAVDRARRQFRAAGAATPSPLPAPLHDENAAAGTRSARCYGFVRAADYRNPFGQSSMYRALQPIVWESAACSEPGAWLRPASAVPAAAVATNGAAATEAPIVGGGRGRRRRALARRGKGGGGRGGGRNGGRAGGASELVLWSHGTAGQGECLAAAEMATCPRSALARNAAYLRRFLAHPPPTWFWCYYSLALDPAHQKKSPGVVALSPGATLHARLDTRMRPSGAAESVVAERVQASIEHLVSYEGMGRAALHCVGGCTCEEQTIDAHRTDAHRNVSVFLQHNFWITGGAASCGVQLQILNSTSSGGYKFKVRTITLTTS